MRGQTQLMRPTPAVPSAPAAPSSEASLSARLALMFHPPNASVRLEMTTKEVVCVNVHTNKFPANSWRFKFKMQMELAWTQFNELLFPMLPVR